ETLLDRSAVRRRADSRTGIRSRTEGVAVDGVRGRSLARAGLAMCGVSRRAGRSEAVARPGPDASRRKSVVRLVDRLVVAKRWRADDRRSPEASHAASSLI